MKDIAKIKSDISKFIKQKLENNSFDIGGYKLTIERVDLLDFDLEENNIELKDLYRGEIKSISLNGSASILEPIPNGSRGNRISFFSPKLSFKYDSEEDGFILVEMSPLIITSKLY